jgi:tetratricopeptide (TPR) repeat protein
MEYEWRVKAHPTDLGLWFTYGRFVFDAGKVDEAIEAFQHAVKDPRHKTVSLHMLGKSFFRKGLYDLAEKQLKNALEASGGVSEKTMPLVYDLGRVAEKVEDLKAAKDWYLKIFEIDINYQDVADKIEKLKDV